MVRWARTVAAEPLPRTEERVAVASAAVLYVVGGSLIGTAFLLSDVDSPAGAAAVAVTAYLTAAALIVAVIRDRGGLGLAFVADMWGLVLIVALCASTGGASSPFALLYFFAVGHAAAYQPRTPFLIVCAAGLVFFLAPLVYSNVETAFIAVACVGVVLALLTTAAIHIAVERMRTQRRRLEFLIAATAKLDTSLDPQQTLRRVAGTALPELAELCVIDLLEEDGTIATAVAAALNPALASKVERLHVEDPPDRHAADPIAAALSTRTVQVFDHLGSLEGWGGEDPYARFMAAAGFHSIAVIPMVARGRMLGTISFMRPSRFESGQLALLEDLSGRGALAYDNARLYAERAHVAHTLRHSLMPAALPKIPGLELESFFRPMSAGSEVGGDFYDVFGDRGDCWLVVGDVCGKGPEAAVLTGFLRHTTVAYAREGAGPGSVLERVNQAMLEHDFEGRFATAILARLGFGGAAVQVTIAAAGHPAALVSRAQGRAETLGDSGTLLGVFPDPSIPESTTLLGPGDGLALYTDGLAEAHAPDRVLTVERMIDQLAGDAPRSARAAIESLLGLVDLGDGARDDIAILAAHVDRIVPRAAEDSPAATAA
jgi:hypothetical protein